MKRNLVAFKSYIAEAKEIYSGLGLDEFQSWDDDRWAAKGALHHDNHAYLHFNELKKSRYNDRNEIDNRAYINWLKARVLVYLQKGGVKNIVKMLAALKNLYLSLREYKAEPHPMYIDDSTLEHLEERMKTAGYADMFGLMRLTLTATKDLKMRGILLCGINYENNHDYQMATDQKALNKRRKKLDAIDDQERDDEDKLISMQAMMATAWLSQHVTDKWEQAGLKIFHLLIATGLRFGELHHLRVDALTSVQAINQTTGLRKLDKDGNPELIWGINYHPEKGGNTTVKWLDEASASLVRKAFNDIKTITEPCREQLRHLDTHPKYPLRWPNETISLRELEDKYLDNFRLEDQKGIFAFKKRLRRKGIEPIDLIPDPRRPAKPSKNGGGRKQASQPVYRASDLNKYYSEISKDKYKAELVYKVGAKSVAIKTSELLLVLPEGALAFRKNLNHLYPTAVSNAAVLKFFGACSHTTDKVSIYNRYDFKEEDGSDIKIETHFPRHQLNTFLKLADVTEHQQALMMGRKDIEQNRAYQHLNLEDKTRHQVTTTESMEVLSEKTVTLDPPKSSSLLSDFGITELEFQQHTHSFGTPSEHAPFLNKALENNSLLGDFQDDFNGIRDKQGIAAAHEFADTYAHHYHIVPNGACTRDLCLKGCPKQLHCLNDGGCHHLTITGRPGELESIEFTYNNLMRNVMRMEAMVSSGELKTEREIETFEKEKTKLSQMEIVLNRARNFSGQAPLRVFPMGKALNHIKGKDTIVQRFAEDQLQLEAVRNG